MSLTRQFFRELRPLFRMLEEPFGTRAPTYGGRHRPRDFFDDPFFNSPAMLRPAVDVSEQGDKYIVEAELPGVKKENVNVRIGDGGRTLTIEGKVVRSEPQITEAPSSSATGSSGTVEAASEGTQAVTQRQPESTALSTERLFTGSASFTRTVVLPQPVDSSKVTAKLQDGVLTVTVPKAEDVGSVQINVE
ncbi:HSP20-like chaperone [Trametes coccinea BRFM310]|uniref:HSP20-like chaperone n=1 Tax=Trametes coccinea (strain BRFM310) TaxID=1353009 RepID=A0A1Y2J1H5_TRAC3|nr:HSP20-like chaperone [Trametes coccinea BRFM310]